MADIVATEITEVSRVPLNQAQGKKLQLLELSITHTFVDDDVLTASVISGCRAIVGILSVSQMKGLVGTSLVATKVDTNFTVRAADAGLATDIGDEIKFPDMGTDLITKILIWLVIESD